MNSAFDFDAHLQRAQRGDADAHYELGRHYAGQQAWSRARRHFRDAAERQHPAAMTELALLTLFGISVPADVPDGVRQLERAEQAGSGEAACQLALMSWADGAVPFDATRMAQRIRFAATQDFPAALRAVALMYARQGVDDPELARVSARCLQRAATLGDGISCYLHGRRLLLAGDEAAALPWLAAATRRKVPRALSLLGTRDPQAIPDPEALPPALDLPALTLVSHAPGQHALQLADPLVETFDDVYTAEECEYIIALGEPFLEASMTIADDSKELHQNDHRRSSDHSFYSFQEDFALRWLQWRMLAIVGAPLQNAEHLVLLRYVPGEEYKPHRDYLPPGAPGNSKRPDQPGQRVHTMFCYLADVEEGGETAFPNYDVRITPKQGRVVHFINMLPDGMPDARTWHAGLPVKRGVKWLATLWTRERRYREY